ncbi:MAG: YggS family pyridoxal phosphate-dependent enzyme [Bacteroidota bacterium]
MTPENIEKVRGRIREACFRCGRNPDEVQLVAVTKTFGAEKIREAVAAGVRDFGENYAQELNEKKRLLEELEPERQGVRWHFIGHLQTNKVKLIANYIHLIHTVDNVRVAEEINKRGERSGRTIDVLVEVHTTDEATKYGIAPGQAVGLVKAIARFPRVRVQGLMTMGPFSEDPEDSRPSFRQIVELKRELEQAGIPAVSMRHLSMGMTHDFEVAIEEGATMVRIGTAIFGPRS